MSEQDFRTTAVEEAENANEDDVERGEQQQPRPGTAQHYEEMAERGANQQGEGRTP